MAAVRIIKRSPDLTDDFIVKVDTLMEDRSHGVLIGAVCLATAILEEDSSYMPEIKRYNVTLVKVLKNLLLSGYAPEHDISGITDPFLQVNILKLLRILGRGDANASDEMNDTLAQVATNTESAKNAGNSILYECVRTIMDIESTSGLRVLAINIMGRFLLNRDNNIRYVALKTMQKVVSIDIAAVTRHRNTILDCLRDPDISIRKKALELTYSIISSENVKSLVKEMINYLLVADAEFKESLVSKICGAVEHHSPSKKWHIDTVTKVLGLGGAYVTDEVIAATAHMISGTPELQSYAAGKLYSSMKENMGQYSLCLLASWCIGEYGNLIVGQAGEEVITEDSILNMLEQAMGLAEKNTLKEYILTALIKLTIRIPNSLPRIRDMIINQSNNISVEIQQRACEYLCILDSKWDRYRKGVLEVMPAFKRDEEGIEIGVIPVDSKPTAVAVEATPNPVEAAGNLLDFDLVLDPTPVAVEAPAVTGTAAPVAAPVQISTEQALFDIFAPSNEPAAAVPAPVMNLFDSAPAQDLEFEEFQGSSSSLSMVAYEDETIKVDFNCNKPDLDNPQITNIDSTISNKSGALLTDVNVQAAVPKHLKLALQHPSGTTLQSGTIITQNLKVTNSMQGEKAITLRLKIDFSVNGAKQTKMATVSSFNADY